MGVVRLRFGRVCCRLGKWGVFHCSFGGEIWWGVRRERLIWEYSAYCGMPAGLEAFRVADRVLTEMEEKGEMVREK